MKNYLDLVLVASGYSTDTEILRSIKLCFNLNPTISCAVQCSLKDFIILTIILPSCAEGGTLYTECTVTPPQSCSVPVLAFICNTTVSFWFREKICDKGSA